MVRKLAVLGLALGLTLGYSTASAHCGECGDGDHDKGERSAEMKKEAKEAKGHHKEHSHSEGEAAERAAKGEAKALKAKGMVMDRHGYEIGDKVDGFELHVVQSGEKKSLEDLAGDKATMLIFWNQECPWCVGENGAEPRIKEIANSYKDKGVNVVLIDAGTNNNQEKISKYAENLGIPVLVNPNSKVAARFDARYTPQTYIIDADNNLVYQGAFEVHKDDNITITSQKALDELLEGEDVSEPEVIGKGCGIKYADGARPSKNAG